MKLQVSVDQHSAKVPQIASLQGLHENVEGNLPFQQLSRPGPKATLGTPVSLSPTNAAAPTSLVSCFPTCNPQMRKHSKSLQYL